MNNKNLAMVLQHDHEDELDSILSDVELMKRAKELAHENFSVTDEDANSIGREILKIYGPVESS